MSLETFTFKVSQQGRDQLSRLKRRTGIPTWNILCRWAFCMSIAESSPPRQVRVASDSPLEINWHTFAGEHEDVYRALLRYRCRQDGFELTDSVLKKQFRLHLHRGISYLAGSKDLNNIGKLVSMAVES